MKIGILGGGQLARMLALSGYPLGFEFICVDPKIDCSAKKVTNVIHCDFNNMDEINRHFNNVDCVTYETENIPLDNIQAIEKKYKLLPNIEALKVTQDRLYEKDFFRKLNIPTAEYDSIETWDNLKKFIDRVNFPVMLKTRRHGYDGKGQMIIGNLNEAKYAWECMSSHALIVEKFIPYHFEVSLISVRNSSKEVSFYPLTLNKHKNGILRISEAPYENIELKNKAEIYALNILEQFNYIGVMTIEFFCLNNALIANEIAPRVHNSGHWTIEGADTSQFENHLRAISGLPLGSTKAKGFSAMINCIGNEPKKIKELLKLPGLHFHTYGKQAMLNRKLGHITISDNNRDEFTINVKKAMSYLLEK